MIPREILEQALADYEKAAEEIQEMDGWMARNYLDRNEMARGLCYYVRTKFDVHSESCNMLFGKAYLGRRPVINIMSLYNAGIPTLTRRLQLRINKLKELLNDNPLPLPK